jgi:protein ImuA
MRYPATPPTRQTRLLGQGLTSPARLPAPRPNVHLHRMAKAMLPRQVIAQKHDDENGKLPIQQPLDAQTEASGRTGSQRLARLRCSIAKLETSFFRAEPNALSLGLPEIHRHLPGPGLACGVLHEVTAAAYGDGPAALGFLFALTSLALQAKPGLGILVASQRAFAQWGRPYGHGLYRLGVDPGRLVLVETGSDQEALWAIEETLRSRVQPAMVTGALEKRLDLTTSRRLNLAAAALATPLALASAKKTASTSAAATCWRIGAMPASRDRFGLLSHPRWSVDLERCRQGRPGKWVVEWNHVAHRFSLVEGLADRPSTQGTSLHIAGCRQDKIPA